MVAAVTLAVVAPTAAHAATWDELHSNVWTPGTDGAPQVLSIRGGEGEAAGAEVIAWTRSFKPNGARVGDQMWSIEPAGDGSYWIRNAGTSNQFALSVKGNAHTNGTPLVQWWFDPMNQYQRWVPAHREDYREWWLRNRATGKCLGITGGGNGRAELGARAVLWDCGFGEDQGWFHDSLPN
ncbi:hypothetical protein Ait01nite_084480 [Actinoplanes italicus]|nr:RICIN domain-containing protein [Actinoplanes italicus]GIE35403.1 hypothetical protein Ait01nite_084480 [Actinoplanes italicus]